MGGVGCVFGAETGAGRPALLCEEFVAEARGVVGPGCVLGVVSYAGATASCISLGVGSRWEMSILFRRCEPHDCGRSGGISHVVWRTGGRGI